MNIKPFALLLAIAAPALAAEPALTIYNQNFAVLRDPAGKVPLQILEQNYRNDPVSQELLLSLFEGKTLDFVAHEPQKPDRVIAGKVVRSGYVPGGENVQPIIEVEGKLQFSLPGEPRFPTLGADTQLKPTLSWVSSPSAGKRGSPGSENCSRPFTSMIGCTLSPPGT